MGHSLFIKFSSKFAKTLRYREFILNLVKRKKVRKMEQFLSKINGRHSPVNNSYFISFTYASGEVWYIKFKRHMQDIDSTMKLQRGRQLEMHLR